MSDARLTIRIAPGLRSRLRKRAKSQGKSESDVVRLMLERELNPVISPDRRKRSFYDALVESGFLGSAPDAPADLSTNKKYMEGFGELDTDEYRRKPRRLKVRG